MNIHFHRRFFRENLIAVYRQERNNGEKIRERKISRSKNKCVKLLTKPGLWLQRFTTNEPDGSQIAVAIESMKAVIPENKEDDEW